MTASCLACVFYRTETSSCHSAPPVVVGSINGAETHWPRTNPDDFCGEFTIEVDEPAGAGQN